LLVKLGVGAGAFRLDFLKLAVYPSKRLLQRLDQVRDRLVTSVEFDASGLLKFSEFRLRQVEEGAIVSLEGIPRQRGEGVPQQGFSFGGDPFFGVELSCEPGAILLSRREFLLSAEERGVAREEVRISAAERGPGKNPYAEGRHEPNQKSSDQGSRDGVHVARSLGERSIKLKSLFEFGRLSRGHLRRAQSRH